MKEATPISVYISKFAMSGKILEEEVWDDKNGFVRRRGTYQSLLLGRDAHYTRADAVLAAGRLRDKRIASLRKQIAKLEAKVF